MATLCTANYADYWLKNENDMKKRHDITAKEWVTVMTASCRDVSST